MCGPRIWRTPPETTWASNVPNSPAWIRRRDSPLDGECEEREDQEDEEGQIRQTRGRPGTASKAEDAREETNGERRVREVEQGGGLPGKACLGRVRTYFHSVIMQEACRAAIGY